MRFSPQMPWRSLLIAAILVPVAVGVVPFSGAMLSLNAFVQPKIIVLAVTTAVTLALWAVSRMRGAELYTGRELWPVGALLALAALSAAFGLNPRTAIFGDIEQGTGLLALALCSAVLWLTTQLLRDRDRLRELTSAVIFTAAGIAVVGLLQQLLLLDVLGLYGSGAAEWLVRRGYGTIGNPDTYAAYLLLPAFLALHRVRTAAEKRERLLWGASLAAILGSLVLAQTRGPLVALAAAGAVYAYSAVRHARAASLPKAQAKAKAKPKEPAHSSKVALLVVGIAVVVALGAGLVWGSTTQFASRFGDLEAIASLGGRLPLWQSALEIAGDRPLLGTGPDTFRLGWYPTRTIEHLATGAGLIVTDPHNMYLHVAATMGFPALVAFLAMVGLALFRGFRTSPTIRPADYEGWLFGLVALTVSMLTSMFAVVLLFVLFLASGVVLAPYLHTQPSMRKPGLALPSAALLLAAALLAFGGLSAAAQLVAAGGGETAAAQADRASRATALAPWDTGLRHLRNDTAANAALEAVFEGRADANARIARAEELLANEQQREPREYLHFYQDAVLLIGAGQHLTADYTGRGIEAGLEGLTLYPNSVELRTGLAAGFMQLDQPARAETMLSDWWDADPQYLAAGVTYVQALVAQDKLPAARDALDALLERFPGNETLTSLEAEVSAE